MSRPGSGVGTPDTSRQRAVEAAAQALAARLGFPSVDPLDLDDAGTVVDAAVPLVLDDVETLIEAEKSPVEGELFNIGLRVALRVVRDLRERNGWSRD